MPSTRRKETKDGKVFYEIRVSRGRGKSYLSRRWYVPDGWSKTSIERELRKQASAFEAEVKKGEVISRAETKQKEAEERAEAAKLKTVRQYADGVFMPAKQTTFSENARSSYRMFLDKHILPVIGDTLLVEITPAMITKLILDFQKPERTVIKKDGSTKTAKGYSHATTVKLYNILNGIFEMAFLDDSISMNPMLKVKRPAPRKEEPQKDEKEKAYTVDELHYILSCVAQEPLKWQAYVNLCADTGARRGELCGLWWGDIDWDTATVTIRRNLQYTAAKGVYVTTPKNGKNRSVDIGQETLSLLRRLREEQSADCISKWVFSQDGLPDPMHPQSPTRYFTKFGERYSVPDFHPHKLRHTSASIGITSGADVVSMSERLGHSDTAVTLRMYAHANEASIRRAGQTVRDALSAEAQKNNKKARQEE